MAPPSAVPAQPRRHPWLYHMTPVSNLESIAREGLRPGFSQSKFGPMSREAWGARPKIFFLPILGGVGMRGFLNEWWHGNTDDIVLLRVPFGTVPSWQSADDYNARHEVWSYDAVAAGCLQMRRLQQKAPWRGLTR